MVMLFTPVFRVEIAGIDKTREVWSYLESLEYTDNESGESDSVQITITNKPAFKIPLRGSDLKLWLGWKEDHLRYFGSFTINEISGQFKPATMTITAKSADLTAGSKIKEKTDREWENISLADIASKIAAAYGCTARVLLNVTYSYQAQSQESDIAFLKRLAGEAGATLSIKDKVYVIAPCGKAIRANAVISYNEVTSGSWTMPEREKYDSVSAKWWDADLAEEQKIKVGGDEKKKSTYTIKKRFSSAAEAKMAAENYKAKLSKGELTLDLTTAGNPSLVSGAEVQISGFSPDELNTKYLAKSVTHSISKSGGWTTRISLDKV